jgi:SAM-dependent methyltransferase
MASAREHYENHLGPVYAWMVGDLDAATAAARAQLRTLGLLEGAGRLALDLGAGPGVHAIALADAGYGVTAIDTCAELLAELRARAGPRAIRCINDDLRQLRRYCEGPLDVIVCMGDTLPHLESLEAVELLFEAIADALKPGGVFVATFRDYAGRQLEGVDRFLPVRQDERRILTCFLEYGDTTVTVHDLLHDRTETGWTLRVSSYSKLRLRPEWTRSALNRLGLIATLGPGPSGMVQLEARRPA